MNRLIFPLLLTSAPVDMNFLMVASRPPQLQGSSRFAAGSPTLRTAPAPYRPEAANGGGRRGVRGIMSCLVRRGGVPIMAPDARQGLLDRIGVAASEVGGARRQQPWVLVSLMRPGGKRGRVGRGVVGNGMKRTNRRQIRRLPGTCSSWVRTTFFRLIPSPKRPERYHASTYGQKVSAFQRTKPYATHCCERLYEVGDTRLELVTPSLSIRGLHFYVAVKC